MDRLKAIQDTIQTSIELKQRFFAEHSETVLKAARQTAEAIRRGGKILIFGNGGSAADAQHFAAELVHRLDH
ncbi:MAG TPA: SIS domain-containing protein, partial [Acidobacteriota bacterium]|nr:SIS domain-containing protein [Acidobacteriota bacterium]